MTSSPKSMRDLAKDRLCADIARHQATLNRLSAQGHACPDTEKQMRRLMESLAVLSIEGTG